MELYASEIYPKIFTRIDSLFKAGEGTLDFLTKTSTCTRICLTLRDVKATPWKAAHGAARRCDQLAWGIQYKSIRGLGAKSLVAGVGVKALHKNRGLKGASACR